MSIELAVYFILPNANSSKCKNNLSRGSLITPRDPYETPMFFLRSIITKKKTYEIPVPHRVNFPDDPPESFAGPNFVRMKYIANSMDIWGTPRFR